MSVTILLSFVNSVRFLLTQMVSDKESKMKESLKIQSMSTAAYGLSYFLIQALFSEITGMIIAIVYVFLGYVDSYYTAHFFISLFLFGIAIVLQTMMITTLFSDTKLAT